ncbi:MAG: LysM peptidoglycan-binding domain-containing protein [Ornithinimicrobium sp.]
MTLRQRALGVLALLGLTSIVIGLPMLLVEVGADSLPRELPTWEQARAALLTPDDGTLALSVLTCLGWVIWALLTLTILLEFVAQVRGARAPSLPGLGIPQSTFRGVVAAALALFIAVPGISSALPARATTLTEPDLSATTASAPVDPAASAQESISDGEPGERPAEATPVSTTAYTVQPGDTLWSIAQRHLGGGNRYPLILKLNAATLQHGPDWINPGTMLRLPIDALNTQESGAEDQVVVEKGDTLSALAEEHLDGSAEWPSIYRASQQIEQRDGRHLSDPDLIYPGWRLDIPNPRGERATDTTSPEHTGSPKAGQAEDAAINAADAVSTLGSVTATAPESATTGEKAANGAAQPARQALTEESASGSPAAQEQTNTSLIAGVSDVADEHAWVLAGLVGSGALLGGGMFLALGNRRRAQSRNRRPGRAIATPDPFLAPVEMTALTMGAAAAATLEGLDDVLRRLGAHCQATGRAVPVLAAAQLAEQGLTLHLSTPTDLGTPWEGSQDQLHWTLPAGTPPDKVGAAEPDQPAPYPLLVSIGASDDGGLWLLNVEDLQVCVTGPQELAHDFARYLGAEVAVNPWSSGVRLDLIGVAEEVAPMSPARVRVGDHEAVADAVADVVSVLDRLEEHMDVPTARVGQVDDETWPARMLLVTAVVANSKAAQQVSQLLSDHSGRTGISMVICGDNNPAHAVQLVLTDSGRLRMPASGLDLIAPGLTADEALGCAALLTHGEQVADTTMPVPKPRTDDMGWRAWSDQAGALRPEHTLPRESAEETTAAERTHTLLDSPDEQYLTAAATTSADLDALSPRVHEDVTRKVTDADTRLDEDLAAWWNNDSPLPRLTLLGPVRARTRGRPMPDRKPYFTEVLAYLALRQHGATAEETAHAFNITPAKCRDYIARCREWLGKNPRTGQPHLPHASKAPAAQTRGGNIYQVVDVLVDADLFRRLRTRAEARGGTEGIEDLRQALKLVQGPPFTQLRRGGWAWLASGDRVDQHMVCAIVDVAHILATHDLRKGDYEQARQTAELAALAAPDEEIPALDLAAVASAEGHHSEAVRLLQSQVCNRTDNPDSLPGDLPDRTQEILDRRQWIDREKVG